MRRAIEWYRKNARLHAGDEIAMATDALAAYRRDVQAGKDSLLVCDTKEMADALNQRLHTDTIDPEAPTLTAARGHRIAVGDLIISRRNDPTISVLHATEKTQHADPVRNGNRWRVYAIDPDNHRIAACRLNDGARTVFTGDYLRDHITNGYAITVHSAHGATADTTHAVLRDTTSRELFHVAMSRGRQANTAYLAPQLGRDDHGGQGLLVLDGESGRPSRHAAELARSIIANDTDRLRTAHNTGNYSVVPERVRALLSRRQQHTAERRTSYLQWQHAHLETASQGDRDVSRALRRERTHEIDL